VKTIIKETPNETVTAYVGNWFEWTGSTSTMKKSDYAGAQRIAMRSCSGTGTSGLLWIVGDHLGSTTKIANYDGTLNSQRRYKPWGEARFGATLPTTFAFTGQRQEVQLGGADGLYYYGARWLDPALGRWLSPDSIVPDYSTPSDWDRYSYVRSNPVKAVDPTGHWPSPSKILSVGATICDLTATAISVAGIVVEAVAAIGGEAFTPLPAVDGVTGLAAGVALYNGILNPVENTLSAISFGLVATVDALDNNHKLGRMYDPISGQEATKFVLGADTTFSLASIAVGNTPITPDALTDTIANVITLSYDIARLKGEEPAWGLRQIRMVKPDYSPGYIEILNPRQEDSEYE
jgi:RHS repeat-associated protein